MITTRGVAELGDPSRAGRAGVSLKPGRGAVTIAVLLAIALGASPTDADAAGETFAGGALAIRGRATLSSYPCPTGCWGAFEGTASLSMKGRHAGTPWTADAVLLPLSFTFPHSDTCFVGLTTWSGTVQAAPFQATGTYGGASTSGVLEEVVGLAMSFTLRWRNVGATAIVDVDATLSLQIDRVNLLTGFFTRRWVDVVTHGTGAGTATFTINRVPECFSAGGPAEMTAVGMTTIAQQDVII